DDELVEADGRAVIAVEETVTGIVPAAPVLPSDGTPAAAPRMEVEVTQTVEMVAVAPPNPVGAMLEAQLTGEAVTLLETEIEIAEDEAMGPNSLDKFDSSKSIVSVLAGKILFANGSANLSGRDRRELKRIANDYKKSGGTVRVIGFASSYTGNVDPLKHQIINFNVSMRRADIVAASLMKHGVAPKDIFVGAKSDAEPVYYEVMPAGQAGNRRAEIYLDF
ncbi:MAG: OmpA family protein, partial [Rhodospirillaceae bacterium]|nr:OmpA family protein [Rhodospirillaceae bacterium]